MKLVVNLVCVSLMLCSTTHTKNVKYDSSCGPQNEKDSDCVEFTESRCSHIKSFAPKAENLILEIQRDEQEHLAFLRISWNVPKQGKSSIWGWQIRIFGKKNAPGVYKCYQINRKSISEVNIENKTIWVKEFPATYMVEVQSLPNIKDHDKTVVRKEVEIPDRCGLFPEDFKACCVSYVNVSLEMDKKNRPTLHWKTRYPSTLNISIQSYVLKWFSKSGDYRRCNLYNNVVVEAHKSKYTFQNLKSSCGNYSIKIVVKFNNPQRLLCDESPAEIIQYTPPVFYRPPPKEPHIPSPTENMTDSGGGGDGSGGDHDGSGGAGGSTPQTENKKDSIATVAFVIVGLFGGILIVVFLVLCRTCRDPKKKETHVPVSPPNIDPKKKETHVPVSPPNIGNVKVFILNPNHCNLCTDVVHRLGSLLMATGRIECKIDIFVPNVQKCRGPNVWIEDMIKESHYVIIPWMNEIRPPTEAKTVQDFNANIFSSALDNIQTECLKDPNGNKVKFIPVLLDHCSIEILPPWQLWTLHTYNIPSKIDDLVVALIGETRRQPDTHWPILQFAHESYITAKKNLHNAADKLKKSHH